MAELADLGLTHSLHHHFPEGFDMGEFVAAFALKQEDFFVAEEGGEVAHGEFAFAGAGTRKFGVVGTGADGDAEADGDVVEQKGAIRRRGGDVHASA